MKNQKNTHLLSLIFAMLIFGTIGVFRKQILIPSSILAMARGFIGSLFLFLIMLLSKKKFSPQAIKKILFLLILSGAMIGFNWILLFEAYNHTSVAAATLCYYAAPIFVIIVSPFMFKERITLLKFFCILTAVFGMVLVSGITKEGFGGIDELIGILFGLGAALLYASVIILNKKIKDVPSYDKTIIQLFSAALVLLPYTLLTEDISSFALSARSFLPILIMGIFHTGIAYALYFSSIEKLSAQTVALLSYIDPITAILLSQFVLREGMGKEGVIGAFLVLGAAIFSEIPQRRHKKSSV